MDTRKGHRFQFLLSSEVILSAGSGRSIFGATLYGMPCVFQRFYPSDCPAIRRKPYVIRNAPLLHERFEYAYGQFLSFSVFLNTLKAGPIPLQRLPNDVIPAVLLHPCEIIRMIDSCICGIGDEKARIRMLADIQKPPDVVFHSTPARRFVNSRVRRPGTTCQLS